MFLGGEEVENCYLPAAGGVEASDDADLCTTNPPCEYPDSTILVLGHCWSACWTREVIRAPPLPPWLALPCNTRSIRMLLVGSVFVLMKQTHGSIGRIRHALERHLGGADLGLQRF